MNFRCCDVILSADKEREKREGKREDRREERREKGREKREGKREGKTEERREDRREKGREKREGKTEEGSEDRHPTYCTEILRIDNNTNEIPTPKNTIDRYVCEFIGLLSILSISVN